MKYSEQMRELIDKLNYYTLEYDKGTPKISDKEWDDLYFALQRLETLSGLVLPNSPTQKIDYQVVSKLDKVEHTHPMLSLDKTKNIEDIHNFVKRHDYICMAKLDGLTCALRYENGYLVRAETRGDGHIGENILHNAKVIRSIPKRIKLDGIVEVDGEIVCKKEDFEEFENEYKNPRNFAAGSIRLLNSAEVAKRNLTFVAWDWINNPCETLGEGLDKLDKSGFTTVPRYSIYAEHDIDYYDVIEGVKEDSLAYPIDGLVFKFNKVAEYRAAGATAHHPNGGLAFKFYDEETPSILTNVTYDISRTGVLTPVAEFETIEIDGSEVSRASLSNMSVMKELFGTYTPFIGTKVYVTKRNCIIPKIERIEEYKNFSPEWRNRICEYPKVCPICGQPTKIVTSDDGRETLVCDNDQCDGKLAAQLEHYCDMTKGMKIKGLSRTTIEKLMDWGFIDSLEDLYKLEDHKVEWVKKPGFGERSVSNILKAIEWSKSCELWQIISAIGCPLIGVTASKQLAAEFKTWDNFYSHIKQNNYSFEKLENFGYEMDYAIKHFNKWDKLNNIITTYGITFSEVKENNDSKLTGVTVVITGSLKHFKNRNELKDKIEAAGGKVASSVSGATTVLVNNNATSTSSKNVAAQKLGIPVLTEEDFLNKYFD